MSRHPLIVKSQIKDSKIDAQQRSSADAATEHHQPVVFTAQNFRGGAGFETRSAKGSPGRGAGNKFDTTKHTWEERSPDWQRAWPSNQQAR